MERRASALWNVRSPCFSNAGVAEKPGTKNCDVRPKLRSQFAKNRHLNPCSSQKSIPISRNIVVAAVKFCRASSGLPTRW